jgi:hypothetical protein
MEKEKIILLVEDNPDEMLALRALKKNRIGNKIINYLS